MPNVENMDCPELPDDVWLRRDEPEIRELIILANWPMLKRVVGRIRQNLPPHIRLEEGDLRSYGLTGLYKALDRYDPSLGHDFDKFASSSVYGAVLDALRTLDWAPRSLRKRQKDMEKAFLKLRKALRRDPTDDELAEELLWTTSDITNTRWQVDISYPRSLDEIRKEAERDLYAVVADQTGNPETILMSHQDSPEDDRSALLTDRMASFIEGMAPQKRAVAIFCYYLGMKQADVAAVLGVPESRVSNLHLAIMDEIHERLKILLTTQEH